MSGRFASADILRCRAEGHHFTIAGSDKTPLKRSLICDTCTEQSGVSTYVAYGVEASSFGPWTARRSRTTVDPVEVEVEA